MATIHKKINIRNDMKKRKILMQRQQHRLLRISTAISLTVVLEATVISTPITQLIYRILH